MSTVQNTKHMSASAQTTMVTMDTVLAVSAAILIGTLIIGAVGFAAPEVVHSAAHDLRHGLVFPCH
ncbi:MAG: CbtB-domain containing protein [Proteobacteria bacterium]|nr:CbtB-domain containing protein [Pseudomonadota bacterium]